MSQFKITYAKGVSLEDWIKLTGENDRLKAQLAEAQARVTELEKFLDHIATEEEWHLAWQNAFRYWKKAEEATK